MKNKYMRRGIFLLLAGIGLNIVGWATEQKNLDVYKWAMGIGTVLFGIGFLLIVYSLIRKVERKAILDERAEEQQEKAGASNPEQLAEK
jgi:hypothetical protein